MAANDVKKIAYAEKVKGDPGDTAVEKVISHNDMNEIKAVSINHAEQIVLLWEALPTAGQTGQAVVVSFDSLTAAQREMIRGPQGNAFTYNMFTQAQLDGLKVKGDKMLFSDLTDAEKLSLQGAPFTYDKFTAAQLAALKGAAGNNGWNPVLGAVVDGARVVMKLTGYSGGTGTAPTTNVGSYLSGTGYTTVLANATNFAGPAGKDGSTQALTIKNAYPSTGNPTEFTVSAGTTTQRGAITSPPASLIYFEY